MEELKEILWAALGCVGVISAVTVPVANVVNGLLKCNAVWSQVVAWIVAIFGTGIAHLAGVIPTVEPMWLTILATGLMNGLVSNGIYDIPVIKRWMQTWFPRN